MEIKIMIKYVNESLKYFNTSHIIDRVHKIFISGTESDEEIEIYNNSSFNGLKQYLMNNTEYQIN